MPVPTIRSRRPSDRRTAAAGVLTLLCFAVAAAARALVETAANGAGTPQRYSTSGVGGPNVFGVADVVATIGVCAAGAGVLLFGATLVLAVRRHRGRRLPLAIGAVTVLMALGAAAAGIAAAQQSGYDAVAGLTVLRTALAGLAAASLPAVCLAALRARADRATGMR